MAIQSIIILSNILKGAFRMKQKNLVFTLVFLTVLLSGCACKHTWTEADCENPQVCSQCGETGAEPLGHDWLPASCTAPETCSRCSKTNGQPLEHRFGNWIMEDQQMHHTCEACGLEESTELDQEMYLDILLQGHWDITALVKTQEKEYYAANVFDNIVGEYLKFEEGNILSGVVNQEDFSGHWEFYKYEKQDSNEIYVFQAFDENGRDLEMHLTRSEKQDLLSVFFGNGVRVLMARYDDIASGIFGKWTVDSNDGSSFSLHFREDHTVICSLTEEFEARWHLTPMQEAGSLAYYGLYIIPTKDDDTAILDGAAILGSAEATAPYCISLNWNPDNIANRATNFMVHTKD